MTTGQGFLSFLSTGMHVAVTIS